MYRESVGTLSIFKHGQKNSPLGELVNQDWLLSCRELFSCHVTYYRYNRVNSPEKLCHNRICCPSNRSKQVQETHTAYIADTQYTRQSLNEKQHTWLHRQCHEWHVAEKVNQSTMVEVIAMQGGHEG